MFHYLNQSNCYELDGVDDSKEYVATRRAMDIVGISSDEQVFYRELFQVKMQSFKYENILNVHASLSVIFSGWHISSCGCNPPSRKH